MMLRTVDARKVRDVWIDERVAAIAGRGETFRQEE
jgi:hypothetical protein